MRHAGSTTSTPSTTTSSARAWRAPPRSACPWPCTPSARPSCAGWSGGDWRAWAASRPPRAELAAIERALELAEATGCSLHVVHVSTGAGVAAVAEARARGVDVTCETCPHYLALTEEDMERLGTVAKCAPPLRPAAEREALWEQLAAGRIALVASDHSPCPPAMKAGGFATAWGGIAGAQTTLAAAAGRGGAPRRADRPRSPSS